MAAGVITQQFDSSASPTTGDPYAILTGQSSTPYEPLSLPPGASGTINVIFTPSAAPGTVVSGMLYVDALNRGSGTVGLITSAGDELAAIPYSYTVALRSQPRPLGRQQHGRVPLAECPAPHK